MKATVTAICIGKASPFRDDEASAIAKQPVEGPLAINANGFVLDEQADRKVHGGPEMAMHLYPQDHHSFWREAIGTHDLLNEPGAFGSNLATHDILESDVYIGDRFRFGTVLLEISQPRQPCWKIEHRFDQKGMVARIIKTGRCGWYFRVVEEGEARAGDTLERVAIGAADWSVERVFRSLIMGRATESELRELSELEPLAPKLRAKAVAKLG